MKKYNHKKIESKWKKYWQDNDFYQAFDKKSRSQEDQKSSKYYCLIEFPYPSGDGLHVGHIRSHTALDVIARKKRMQGKNVLYPIGWDAFGLPTENYAIKTGKQPAVVTKENVAIFKKQIKKLGISFDWSREINTTDPNYYKWTQWIFLQLFKHGLAYKKKMAINWCPSCKTGLANEEVIEGNCERCGAETTKKDLSQWMLNIRSYADRLIDDLDEVEFLDKIKAQQINWIGRSEGARVKFQMAQLGSQNDELMIEVFTTRPDTLFGVTYMVLSPEHELVEKITTKENLKEVEKYQKQARTKSDLERTELQKEKTGVFTGAYAINPVNNEKIPVWIADYVLASYGTGAIMAVPAHDQRDYEFAKKYSLEIKEVVSGGDISEKAFIGIEKGEMINSEFLNDLKPSEAIKKIITWLEEKNLGKKEINYKLRDWVFSRQHYWGEPIPLVYCDSCAKNNKNVLVLHGWEDNSTSGFIPEFRKEIELSGYKSFAFNAPNTEAPNFEEWFEFAENKIKENKLEDFCLVGHSMGGLLALKLAEKHKLKKLVLVAPVGIKPSDDYFAQFKDEIDAQGLKTFKNYQDRDLDIKKIKENVEEIIFIFGKKDTWINSEIRDFYINNFQDKAKILIKKDVAHMSEDEGVKKLEDLENLFKENIGWIALEEKDLPLKLPEVEKYEPTDTGESPLAAIEDWVKTTCPKCGGEARRETDTMPNWAGSSWYFLRYIDPKNNEKFADFDKLKYWTPVDLYNGGMEHTTLHLLYSRFWHKFLFDIGVVPTKEPYQRRVSHGMILAEDNQKMSKSRGNVINPDTVVEEYGADVLRAYEMFMGPYDQEVAWNTKGIRGIKRFLDRVYSLAQTDFIDKDSSGVLTLLHQTIKKVSTDIEEMKFNTAISSLMILLNKFEEENCTKETFKIFIKLLNVFMPFVCEEIWQILGNKESVTLEKWPEFDKKLIIEDTFNLAVQINGKLRDNFEVSKGLSEEEVKKIVLARQKISNHLENKEIKKFIYVKDRLVSIVI